MTTRLHVALAPHSFTELQQRIISHEQCCVLPFGPEQRYSICAFANTELSYRDGLSTSNSRQQISDLTTLLENFFASWEILPPADPYLPFTGGKFCLLNFEALLELAGENTRPNSGSLPQALASSAENFILFDHLEQQATLIATSERALYQLEQAIPSAASKNATNFTTHEVKRSLRYQDVSHCDFACTFVQQTSQQANSLFGWPQTEAESSLAGELHWKNSHHAVRAKTENIIFSQNAYELSSNISLRDAESVSSQTLHTWEHKLSQHQRVLQQFTQETWQAERRWNNGTLSCTFRFASQQQFAPLAVLHTLLASPFILPNSRELELIQRCEKTERRTCGGAAVLWNGRHLHISSLGEAWEYANQELSHFSWMPLNETVSFR